MLSTACTASNDMSHKHGITLNGKFRCPYKQTKRHLFAILEMIAPQLYNRIRSLCPHATAMNRFRPGWMYDITEQEHEHRRPTLSTTSL